MKLARWMKLNEIGDTEMGRQIGVDRSTVNRIRRGIQIPLPETARQIVAVTKGKVGWRDLMEPA